MVDTFLTGSGAAPAIQIVNDLKTAALQRPGCSELKIRNQKLTENPFNTFSAAKIDNAQKLHSLFSAGWESWLNASSPIRQKYPDSMGCCSMINKLIKKSIETAMPNYNRSIWWKLGQPFRWTIRKFQNAFG